MQIQGILSGLFFSGVEFSTKAALTLKDVVFAYDDIFVNDCLTQHTPRSF